MSLSAGGMECVGIVVEICLRIDRFTQAAGLKWSGSMRYINVGGGDWLAGFQRSSKERRVGEWKGQAEGSGAWC